MPSIIGVSFQLSKFILLVLPVASASEFLIPGLGKISVPAALRVRQSTVNQGIVGGLVIGLNEACPAGATKCDNSGLTNSRAICCSSESSFCYRLEVSNMTWPYCCMTGMDCANVLPTEQVCGDPDWVPCFTSEQYKCCKPNQVCTYDFGEGCYDVLPTVSTSGLVSFTSKLPPATSTTTSSSSTIIPAQATESTTPNSNITPVTGPPPVTTIITTNGGLSSAQVGGIAGGVGAAVFSVCIALGVGIYVGRRRRKRAQSQPAPIPQHPDVPEMPEMQYPPYPPYTGYPPQPPMSPNQHPYTATQYYDPHQNKAPIMVNTPHGNQVSELANTSSSQNPSELGP